jgi:alpha-mannosidase
VPVEGMEIVTLTGHPVPHAGGPVGAPAAAHEHAALEARLREEAVTLGPDTEPAQPVYARYWLHNSGPAPRGNLPVALHLSAVPAVYGRPVDEPFELRLTVASDATVPVTGTVRFVAPEGWRVEPAERPFELPPGGHLDTPVTVTRPADVPSGVYWLAARLAHGGQEYEDVVRFAMGDADHATPELAASLDVDALRLAPGGTAVASVTLRSTARTEVRGQAWWLSPWGSWQLCPEWTRGFAVPAGGETTLEFPHRAPLDSRPGTWWGLVKLAWGGRVYYTECVPVEVTGAGG